MKLVRGLVMVAVVAALAAGGCSKGGNPSAGHLFPHNPVSPGAPGDTTPTPPPPPQPPVVQPAVFAGWDTTRAGQTGDTRWTLGNDSGAPFVMSWTLTSDDGWPGFPKAGSVALAAYAESTIAIPVTVPATVTPGMYRLVMTVTRPGNLEYTTDGYMRVIP